MGRFTQYIKDHILIEKGNAENNADLIYQKMLDVLDNAHIDFDEDMISFHIGRIIKNSNVDLNLVIRQAGKDDIALGKNKKNGALTIVISVRGELPARKEIDAFLSKDRKRAQTVKSLISQYINTYYKSESPSLIHTKYEEEVEANSSLDDRYEKLIKTMKERINDYNGMIEDLKDDMETENMGTREAAKRAMSQLRKEQFGNDVDEFKKIAMGLFGVSKMMSKENKDLLNNRLDSFYDQKIKTLIGK
jgi:hypothetical protein